MTIEQSFSKAASATAVQALLLRAAWRARRWTRSAMVRARRVHAEHTSLVIHAAWAVTAAFVATTVLLTPVRATGAGDVMQRLLRQSGGDLSDKGFKRAYALDPAAAAIAFRLAPLDALAPSNAPAPTAIAPSTQDMPGLTPDQARQINASIPFSSAPNPAARPFVLPASDVMDQTRALDCLTAAVYYEAAGEPIAGQQAVAQVVLNRLRHPAFPKTVCGVVFEGSNQSTGCQFTFTCDGSLARIPSSDGWLRARRVAAAALGGFVMRAVGDATHYHAEYVVPYWATSLVKIGKVGSQFFYRWTGGWGAPGAFTGRYAGIEPVVDLAAAPAQTPPADPALALATAATPLANASTPAPVVTTATVTPAAMHVVAAPAPIAAAPPVAKPAPAPAKPAAPPSPPETMAVGPAWERR
ncbi:MAG TPA: cell wall hydrolase [Caulobacteraceae bacterium]|jgi:spore germination cell wall hydrolase CwlJ-like protein|nr:cell wall hydrolase [Caulobacteraceae bacterium]